MQKKLVRRGLLWGLGISASVMLVQGLWIPAKAKLSQYLIANSWQQSVISQQLVRPWPWADTYAIAKLTLPRLKQEVIVLQGADPSTLAFSAGTLHQFSISNQQRPIVIAGHRDTHFQFLSEVVMKDIIMLADRQGRKRLYQVEALEIIDTETESFSLAENEPNLVLVTCYPFDAITSGSKERYVVKARLLDENDEQALSG